VDRRLLAVKRVVQVQRQLQSRAEWKLSRLEAEERALEQAARDVLNALNGEDSLHGLFVPAMAGRLRSIARETERVGCEKERQAELLTEQTGKVKRAERMAETLAREALRAGETKQLDELIDRVAARPASLR
jgi:hypothetical protein